MAALVPAMLNSCDSGEDARPDPATRPSDRPSTQPAAEAGAGGRAARTGIVYDPVYRKHLTGSGHPECPARCDAIMNALSDRRFQGRLTRLELRPATRDEILACHTEPYYQLVQACVAQGAESLGFADTNVSPDSFNAAVLAAGGVFAAVDAVFRDQVPNAFCVVRPPGHHALPGKGMGFCIFNNIALAAKYAQKTHQAAKVLIADWDVHHGNGTQEIFYEDDSVLFFSTHQWPWYPGSGTAAETGRGKGRGFTINCPLPAGSGRKEILGDSFTGKLVPAAERFQPDLVLVSAGFDSRKGDPLGRFRLIDRDFADLTALLLEVAGRHADGRLVSVLEGGYDLPGLASAAAAHAEALTEAPGAAG